MNTRLALITGTVALMLIGNLAVLADRSQRETETEHQPVAKGVANKPVVTETETHRIRCAEIKDGTCTEYIIFRVVKE